MTAMRLFRAIGLMSGTSMDAIDAAVVPAPTMARDGMVGHAARDVQLPRASDTVGMRSRREWVVCVLRPNCAPYSWTYARLYQLEQLERQARRQRGQLDAFVDLSACRSQMDALEGLDQRENS